MNSGITPCIFFDTSFLLNVSFAQNSDWQKILLLSKERKLNLYTSKIVIEEWRTHKRDDLLSVVKKAKKALSKMHDEWKSNIIREGLALPISEDELPNENEFEQQSNVIVNEFIQNNFINIVEAKPDHGIRVWHKYFSWARPFKDSDDRANVSNRQARRKDIPDAWIIEAILDLKNEGHEVICLCGDGNIKDTLGDHEIPVFETASDILKRLSSGSEPQEDHVEDTPRPTMPSLGDQKEENTTAELEEHSSQGSLSIDSLFELLQKKENNLMIKVLGFSSWFSPISKEELLRLLLQQGCSEAAVRASAQRLVTWDLLKDTGTHYLSVDKDISKQAAAKVKPDVLTIIGRS